MVVTGVDPTDWKSRSGAFGARQAIRPVPNHDGGGIVDAVGSAVAGVRAGESVRVIAPTVAGSATCRDAALRRRSTTPYSAVKAVSPPAVDTSIAQARVRGDKRPVPPAAGPRPAHAVRRPVDESR